MSQRTQIQSIKLLSPEKKALEKIRLKNIVDYIQLISLLKTPARKLNSIIKSLKKKSLIKIKKENYYNEISLTAKGSSVRLITRISAARRRIASNGETTGRISSESLNPSPYPINLRIAYFEIKVSMGINHQRLAALLDKIELYIGPAYTSQEDDERVIKSVPVRSPYLSEVKFINFMNFLRAEHTHQIYKIRMDYWSGLIYKYQTIYKTRRDFITSPMNQLESHLLENPINRENNLFDNDTSASLIIYFQAETNERQEIIYSALRLINPEMTRETGSHAIVILRNPTDNSKITSIVNILAHSSNFLTNIYCKVSKMFLTADSVGRYRYLTFNVRDYDIEPEPENLTVLDKFSHWLNNTNWKQKRRKR